MLTEKRKEEKVGMRIENGDSESEPAEEADFFEDVICHESLTLE